MKYTNILFDFDGTLADSGPGIRGAVAYALRAFGLPVDESTLNDWIGPPLLDSFMQNCGCSRERAFEMIAAYREYYEAEGLAMTDQYEGVQEMLSALKAAGLSLMVATSKPEPYAVSLLKTMGLFDYFDYISGATMDESRASKQDVIRYALQSCSIGGDVLSRTLMVGDRDNDVLGAKACGLACMGVLYGFGDEEELRGAGAEYIAATPWEVVAQVLER